MHSGPAHLLIGPATSLPPLHLIHYLLVGERPHLQLEDALLDGASDDEARDVDGLELAQAVDAVLRLLLHRRVPPACKLPSLRACLEVAHECADPIFKCMTIYQGMPLRLVISTGFKEDVLVATSARLSFRPVWSMKVDWRKQAQQGS